MTGAYIDVRGVWPVYVEGQTAIELVNQPRTITVEEAARLLGRKP